MNIEQLRKALRAQPFQPFTICLADGREFLIPHPECVIISPDATRSFGVAGPKEEYRIVNLLLASSLDFVNGKVRRRGRR
jgi:hypothetical protein